MRTFIFALALLIAVFATTCASIAAAAPSSRTTLNGVIINDVLAAHNAVRQRIAQAESQRLGGTVSIPDMTWDPSLAALAQDWANQQLGLTSIPHRPADQRPNIGENIFTANAYGNVQVDQSITAAMSFWAGEQQFYTYDANTCAPNAPYGCGHYTQVVWSGTTRVGCGQAFAVINGTQYVVWVCNYGPAGNVTGQRPYSVSTTPTTPPTPVVPGSVLFYNATSGVQATATLDSRGSYRYVGVAQGTSQFTHVVATAGGGVLFLNAATGTAITGRLDTAGHYQPVRMITGFGNWTHVVAANQNGLFFYDSRTGIGATARLDSAGTYQYIGVRSGLGHWTHVVGTANGSILFYNASTGNGETGWLDASGWYHDVGPLSGFGQWTQIVAANQGSILFYNAATGIGATAWLDNRGRYHYTGVLPQVGQWTQIVGTTGGGLLFYNAPTGVGATGQMGPAGQYLQLGTITGFGQWSQIVAR